ncbi:MAG: hypothetical protein R3B84_20025 [Zavarzinella sp.]
MKMLLTAFTLGAIASLFPAHAAEPKPVLLIIANQDFYYREYADPKQVLEQVGIKVVIGAGRKSICRPHPGSGQSDSGEVMPDIALADARGADYSAIVFAGGWGASSYQYSFTNSYTTASYNGTAEIRKQANRLITESLTANNYVCGICHGVSVLAWARVDGKSPLTGKKVCAPAIAGPQFVHNRQQTQPSSRWHSEFNKATVLPSGSVGNRSTVADDVVVDGKIITAENFDSASTFGTTLAKVLLK